MACSEQEIGYNKGDVRMTLPPLLSSASSNGKRTDSSTPLTQLVYKDLSDVLPPFQELRDAGFMPPLFKNVLFHETPWFPPLPADILTAQANFVENGCILATNFHHQCFDGTGAMTALRVWAESCRYIQGDTSATCSWLDHESLNGSLPNILYEQEGYARPAHEVDPSVWGLLTATPPEEELENGTIKTKILLPTEQAPKFAWPPPPPPRHLESTTFFIPHENLQKLKEEVVADFEVKGAILSVSDIVQAFFWRAAIKARYRVAKEHRGETFGPADVSVLELPIDARPYFSPLLPSSYMGNLLVVNRPYLPVETLCAPETSVGRIAHILREATARITPSLVHDAFTLLQSISDYNILTSAATDLAGMHAMLNNLMLFQTSEISFGDEFFADEGCPDAMRIDMDKFNAACRMLIILPMRKDGGVELFFGTLPEEFEMLKLDEEFTKYAKFIG